MIENIGSVAVQVLILFVLVAVGFVCQKINFIKEEAIKGMSDLVVYIVTPANIIVAFLRDFKSELLLELLISFGLAFAVYFFATVIAKLLIREKDENKNPVLRFASAYPNAGYMGIPLQKAILGDIGVFYCAAYIAVFHMYIWSYGVKILKGPKSGFNIKKALLSIPVISIFIGLFFFVTGIELPEVILSPLTHLSAMATPLPMFIIGYYLGAGSVKDIFGNKFMFVAAAIKLVISPIIALAICLLFNLHGPIVVACLIACSSSSGAMTTMLAAKYNRDTSIAAGMVSLTTLSAIITMPVFIAIAQMIA